MFEHVVAREQAPHQHFRRRDPTAAVPGIKRLVGRVAVDPADPTDAVDADDLSPTATPGAAHLLLVTTKNTRPLSSGEDAAVETSERDPLRAVSCPAEGLQRLPRSFVWATASRALGLKRCFNVSMLATVNNRRKQVTWEELSYSPTTFEDVPYGQRVVGHCRQRLVKRPR